MKRMKSCSLRRHRWAGVALITFAAGCAGESSGGGPDPGEPGVPLTVYWTAPTINQDGTALDDLAGFKVYDGDQPGNYVRVTDVGQVTQATLENLSLGTHYIVVTAYDTSGNDSDFSNEISVTLP